MKKVIVFGLMAMFGFSSAALAQVTSIPGEKYREFVVNLKTTSDEEKTVMLLVNTELRVDSYGEPEIPQHGFYDYMVTGTVVEGDKRCNFEALLTQTDLVRSSTDETLKSRRDRPTSLRLCSGLTVEINSVRSLLLDSTLMVGLKAPGLNKAIGTGALVSNGLKTVPDYEIED